MPEVDVTYADVKFTTPRSRGERPSVRPSEQTSITASCFCAGNVATEDVTYSEVKISNKQQAVCSNCSANIQQSGSSRRSKVTPERVVLLGLVVLLAAALIALGVTYIKPGSKTSTTACPTSPTSPTSPKPPTCPEPPTCPPPPAVKNETCLKCEARWEPHGGNCYYFNTNKSSWTDSRRSCADLGSDLVKIDSREEQMFLVGRLRGLMEKGEDMFWIGLSDSVEEGKWFWVDGFPLNESLNFWCSTPDDWKGPGKEHPEGEDCATMGTEGEPEKQGCWADVFCFLSQKSICEKTPETGQTFCV